MAAGNEPRGSAAPSVLPVWAGKDTIIARLRSHDTIVLVGETGSGKTTQVPQFLLQAGLVPSAGACMIAVTQPRRVAATSLARRVASEMGCTDPATVVPRSQDPRALVGYAVRFDDRTSRATRIKFLTDGMLIREILGPAKVQDDGAVSARLGVLKRYGVLIIDEAHERSLRTDMVLGLAKRIQRERLDRIARGDTSLPPLKIVVMSATIDAKAFATFFTLRAPPPILYVAGRQHGVRLYHTQDSCQDWTDAAVRTVMQIHVSKPRGDVLVFATGQEEIEALSQTLQLLAAQVAPWAREHEAEVPELLVRPLYAALGPSASSAVFAPTPDGSRKVVLATNIAETSVTIPGIRYVVDSGLAKEKVFSPQTGVETLQVRPISQSSSLQRAGRAGREASGECYRLYTRPAYDSLQPMPIPEIHRTELSGAVLQLYAMGVDPFTFDWIDPPEHALLQEAVLHLAELGAVASREDGVRLTALGLKLAALPVTPSYARLLVAAAEHGPQVAGQARDLVSILSADRSLFVEAHDADKRDAVDQAREIFFDASGDHATMLNALRAYMMVRDHAYAQHATPSAARQELRMWCQTHFVHDRTVQNVLAIRKQLSRICAQHGIVCDDGTSATENEAQESESEDEDALMVERPGSASLQGDKETYTALLQCLGIGRLSHTALRQPDGSFRRVAGGQVRRTADADF